MEIQRGSTHLIFRGIVMGSGPRMPSAQNVQLFRSTVCRTTMIGVSHDLRHATRDGHGLLVDFRSILREPQCNRFSVQIDPS